MIKPLEYGNELTGQNDLSWMQRGFTGHEHIKELGLINMSGRVFDPLLGRFLSPDPYVQSPDRTKNFNRYAYAMNNPLVFEDPGGESITLAIAIGATIGAYFGGKAVNDGKWDPTTWDLNAKTLGGIGVGAIAGGYAAGLGVGVGGLEGAFLGGMSSGGINGAGMTAINGGDFSDIMAGATKGAVIGGFTGVASYGAAAGLGALGKGIDNLAAEAWTGNPTTRFLGNTLEISASGGFQWVGGINPPSLSTAFHNTAMYVNGALNGNWGTKLVPAGRTSNESFLYPVGFNNWHQMNRGASISGYMTPQVQRQRDFSVGNNRRVRSINRVQAGYHPSDVACRFSLNGLSTGFITNSGRSAWLNVNGGYNYGLQTRTGFSGSYTSPSMNLNMHGRVYRRYGTEGLPNPWWRQFLFFGL